MLISTNRTKEEPPNSSIRSAEIAVYRFHSIRAITPARTTAISELNIRSRRNKSW